MGESLVPYLAATSPVACFLNPLLSIIRGVRGASAQAKFPAKRTFGSLCDLLQERLGRS